MIRALAILALCVGVVLPVDAFAQPVPPATPSPELRSMMEKVRAEAKASALAAVTPAHAGQINALTAKVAAGSLDPREASMQIDGFLTGDEQKAVLAAADKSRSVMRQAMMESGAGPMGPGGPGMRAPGGPGMAGPPGLGGPPPGAALNGGPPGNGMHGPGDGMRRPGGRGFMHPTAGRYIVMVSMTPDQRRKLQPRARSSAAP